jgi:hypothetical protein
MSGDDTDTAEAAIDARLGRWVAIAVAELLPDLLKAELARQAERVADLAEGGVCVCRTCGSILPGHRSGAHPKIADIQEFVARQFGLQPHDMVSDVRAREVARPRQLAMYLTKRLTPASLHVIGRAFGGRDHTTVAYAVRTIESLMLYSSDYAESVAQMLAVLTTTHAARRVEALRDSGDLSGAHHVEPTPRRVGAAG